MNTENKLGKKVKNLRIKYGYTQEQLAELLDIDDKHLSKIEHGVHLPTYKTLKKLSEVLNFNLQDMDTLSSEEHLVTQSKTYFSAMRILNNAKDETELKNYYDALKLTSRIMKQKAKETGCDF